MNGCECERVRHNITDRLTVILGKVRSAQRHIPVNKDSLIAHDLLEQSSDYIHALTEQVHKQIKGE